MANLLRSLKPHEHARVGFAELFFDLVFVFAVTQLSSTLVEHYSPRGAIETLVLFVAVWWAWVDTAWATNWLDPQRPPVRLMLLLIMLAGLLFSTSIPEAYGPRGLVLAGAYAFIQVGRSLFTLYALKGHNAANFRNFQRFTLWLVVLSLLWIAGGLAEGNMRLAIWAVAVILETIAPNVGFFVPGLGSTATTDVNDLEGEHFAERCGLFVIIALGESILVIGTRFAALDWHWLSSAAFLVAFIGSVAMWWIYFDSGHARGSHRLSHSPDPGRLARFAYSLMHMPIVLGIILTAVGDELLLFHPDGSADDGTRVAVLGGPALYLVAVGLFRRAIAGRWQFPPFAGVALLAAAAFVPIFATPFALAIAAGVCLIVVAAWESLTARPARRHPS